MSDEKKQVAVPPKRSDFVPLNKVPNLSDLFAHPDFRDRIAKAAPKYFNAERLLRTMVQSCQKTPKLNDVSPMSMLGACITVAALGLEPNTPLQYSHLIPFEVNKWNADTRKRDYVRTDVQVIIGYQGYLELIYRNDKIKSVECDVFYEDDIKSGRFRYSRGSKRELIHNLDPSIIRDPATPIAGAYMFVELQNGGTVFEVMSLADLHRSRARSQGYQAAMFARDQAIKANKDPLKDKRYADAPWIKDEIQMCKKTVLRIGQKWVPKTIELASALTIDGEAEDVTIDFSTITSADNVFDGTYETVETEKAQIAEDRSPKITVPTEKEKVLAEKAVEKPQKSKVSAASRLADDLPAHMRDEPPYAGAPEGAPGWTKSAESSESTEGNEEIYPLFNYLGEGDDGPFGAATDPVAFAKEFARVYAEATPDQRITLCEFNDDSIVAANQASEEAMKIITLAVRDNIQKADVKPTASMAEVKAQTNSNPQSSGPTDRLSEENYDIPRSKTPKGGWDVVEWTRRAKIVIAGCESRAAIVAVCAVNRASIDALPTTAATIFQNYVDDRLRILDHPTQPEDDEIPSYDEEEVPMPYDGPKPTPSEIVAGIKQERAKSQDFTAAEPPKDKWEMMAQEMMTEFRQCKSRGDLGEMAKNVAVKAKLNQLRAERPELAARLNDAYMARDNELKG